jgi:hypothetical protein
VRTDTCDIPEDVFATISAIDHVINCPRILHAQLSWHGENILPNDSAVKSEKYKYQGLTPAFFVNHRASGVADFPSPDDPMLTFRGCYERGNALCGVIGILGNFGWRRFCGFTPFHPSPAGVARAAVPAADVFPAGVSSTHGHATDTPRRPIIPSTTPNADC